MSTLVGAPSKRWRQYLDQDEKLIQTLLVSGQNRYNNITLTGIPAKNKGTRNFRTPGGMQDLPVVLELGDVLELANVTMVLRALDEDERTINPVIDSIGRLQEALNINKPA